MSNTPYPHAITPEQAKSAQALVKKIFDLCNPGSVLDIGCGPGLFLNEFKELGVTEVYGIDHKIDQKLRSKYLSDSEYHDHNLNTNVDLGTRFDLALCLEVAEHLSDLHAKTLVQSICKHADLVLFSAAIPYQGGIDHINEQWPEYWIELFHSQNYTCYDVIRPAIWDDEQIEWWYRQNTFIFSKHAVQAFEELPSFMAKRLVHPGQLNKYKRQLEGIYAGKKKSLNYLKWLVKSLTSKQ